MQEAKPVGNQLKSRAMKTAWTLYNRYFRSKGRTFNRVNFGKSLRWAWERVKSVAVGQAAAATRQEATVVANAEQQVATMGGIDIRSISAGVFWPRSSVAWKGARGAASFGQ
jgi:hypothetical protein